MVSISPSWLEERSDPRVSDWLLMSSPVPTVCLCLTYLVVVKVAGPLYMKDRPAYSLKYPMMAYNLFQVLFNGWIFTGQWELIDIQIPPNTLI